MARKIAKFCRGLSMLVVRRMAPPEVRWFELNPRDPAPVPAAPREIPRIIWMYWDSEDVPALVSACVENIRTMCPGYRVEFLSKRTAEAYVTVPTLSDALPKALYADVVRLMLLEQYGGVWIDATVILQDNLDWILSRLNGQDAFLFYSDECTIDPERPISENWFIAAPKGSAFIRHWREEFVRCVTSADPEHFYDGLADRAYHLQALTKPGYLLCYISCIVVLTQEKYNILYAPSGATGHYLNYFSGWNDFSMAVIILWRDRKLLNGMKIIKICSSARKTSEKLLRHRLLRRRSLVGALLDGRSGAR